MLKLRGILSGVGSLQGELASTFPLDGMLTVPDRPQTYDGSYEVTPSTSAQTLDTANLLLAHNITINPIPSNYGLITWNGSVLTVS